MEREGGGADGKKNRTIYHLLQVCEFSKQKTTYTHTHTSFNKKLKKVRNTTLRHALYRNSVSASKEPNSSFLQISGFPLLSLISSLHCHFAKYCAPSAQKY